jgi:hypothetical protein
MWVQQDNQVTDNNQHGGEVMRNNPDDLANQLVNKIKEHCDQEVEVNEEHPWHTITDGTGDISRGRLEFAEGLLEQIKKWENE